MNICFLGLEIIPTKEGTFVGGIANNVVRLAKGLAKRGHQICIITSDVNSALNSVFTAPWGEIHSVPIKAPYASAQYGMELIARLSYNLLKERSKRVFDVFHIHSGYSVLGIFSSLIHVPVIFTLYSPMPRGLLHYNGLYSWLSSRALSRLYLSKAERIITVSENIEKSLRAIGIPDQNIACIPPAIDMEMFNPHLPKWKVREELGINDDAPVILYCGNWNPWKGVDVLIDSMANVIRRFPDAKLVLAFGEAIAWQFSRRIMVSEKIKMLGLEPNIIKLGIVKDVSKLMAASDIVVVPFLNTYGVADRPLTVLEAMACGKPVIATKVGGIPEVIQNGVNGILVTPRSSDEIEEAVCFLLKNKKKAAEIGLNAAQTALSYSIDRVVPMLEKVYEDLISNA